MTLNVVQPIPPMSPRARKIAGGVAVVTLVSALGMGAAAFTIAPQPLLLVVGFEVVNVVAMALAIRFALGRDQVAPGLAAICFAGTVFATTVLGLFSVRQNVGLPAWVLAFFALRMTCALIFAALAIGTVLTRDKRSVGLFVRALLLMAPVVVVVGALALPQVRGVVQQFPGWAKAIVYGVLGLTVVGLLAAGGHLAIRAFEMGRLEGEEAKDLSKDLPKDLAKGGPEKVAG